MSDLRTNGPPAVVGRYSVHGEIAQGGMATVHLGRLLGPVGFSRTVAIKRLHAMFAKDPEFVAMFMDEARLAARIRHPNVVSIIDVVAEQGELLLVMDYVQGESLSRLLRCERHKGVAVDPRISVKIIIDVLEGLHAAHEACNERGRALGIVHRDVSPQNIIVGADGVSRVIDFGVAKAVGRMQRTRIGQLKGKLGYMSPEQIRSEIVDRRTDIYSASAVLWEALAGRRLFKGDEASLMYAVLTVPISPPSVHRPELSDALDAVVRTGLHKDPGKRFATALEMVEALDAAVAPASSRVVARWIQKLAADALEKRADMVAEVENVSHVSVPPEALLTDVTSEISISESAQPLPTIGDHVPVEIEKLGASDVQPVDSERDPKEPDVSRPALNNSVTIVASMSSAPLPDATRSRRRLWVGVGLWAIAWVGLIWFVARRPSTPAPALASTSAAVPATSPVALVEPAQPTASLFQLASASAPRAPSSVMPSVSVAPTTRSPSPPAPSTNRSNRANPPPAKTTPTTPTRQKTSTNRRYTRD